jgi:hypothetical protein
LIVYFQIVWIQNDLFARHYLAEAEAKTKFGVLSNPALAAAVAAGTLALTFAFQYFRLARS